MDGSCIYAPGGFPLFCAPGDLGPMINGVSWMLVGTATIFLALRVYCKIIRYRQLQLDDYVVIAAWVNTSPDPIPLDGRERESVCV
jgi:hypothetical protein